MAACVRRTHPEIWISVSVTTRRPRPGEIDGVHYGTPRKPVEEHLDAGQPALLEIDLQGARQVHARMPDALMCFLAPPSWAELERRLVGRGTEGPNERERRLATARVELGAEDEFDVTIVNTDVESACEELVDLFRSGISRLDS